MDLGPVERLTTGTRGEPGDRTFYLQARHDAGLLTVIVEKEQIRLLATSILEMLADLSPEVGSGGGGTGGGALGSAEEASDLEEPLEPLWRTGRLSLGYDEVRDLFLLELEELATEDAVVDGESVRLWAGRDQMLALAEKGAAEVERGRPRCALCGNPMDPEGHACPATNGHAPRG